MRWWKYHLTPTHTRRQMQTSHNPPSLDKPPIGLTHNHLYSRVDSAVAAAQGRDSLSAMVLVLLPLMRSLGIAILRLVIEQRDRERDRARPSLPCPGCQAPLVRTRHLRPSRRYTLLGLLQYDRRNYLCLQCTRSEYPTDWGLDVLDRLHGHSQEFASLVVLMTTLMPNAKAMDLFQKCFGFVVSTTLARGLSFELGSELVRQEKVQAELYWAMRTKDPEALEPVPAVLAKMQRSKRKYVMMDDSKLGIQEGKRGRGAPRRLRDESKQAKALRKILASEKAKAAKAAKRGKPGANSPVKMPKVDKEGEDGGFRNVRALLIFDEKDLAGVSKGRHEILRRRVIAHIGTLKEWYQFVHMALAQEGVYTAEEVFAIADGGAGIWEMFDELLPTTRERRVHQVLDFYHASSYVWAAGRAYKGNETSAQRKACIRWVQPLLALTFYHIAPRGRSNTNWIASTRSDSRSQPFQSLA